MLALLATAATAYAGATPMLPGAGVPGAGVDNARAKDQFRDRIDLGTAGLGDCIDCLLDGVLDASTWAVSSKRAGDSIGPAGSCWECILEHGDPRGQCDDECGEGPQTTDPASGEPQCVDEPDDQCTDDSGDDILGGCQGPVQCGQIDTATILEQAGTEIETEVQRTEVAGATGTH